MKWLIRGLLIVILCIIPHTTQAQTTALIIPAGQRIIGNVATVSQDIRVEGTVDGDVTSWSGAIFIAGAVGGDVISYSGAVTIAPTGHVNGHVLASDNLLRTENGAVVAGQKIDGDGNGALASLFDLLNPGMKPNGNTTIEHILFGFAIGVLLVAFCLLYGAFWPGRILIASITLRRLPGRTVGLGFVASLVLAFLVFPLAGVLLASVIGVPVLFALLVVLLALYVYGVAVLARTLSIQRMAQPTHANTLDVSLVSVTLVLALVIAIVMVLAPVWGLILFSVIASPGLGAILLSRGGMALPVTIRP